MNYYSGCEGGTALAGLLCGEMYQEKSREKYNRRHSNGKHDEAQHF